MIYKSNATGWMNLRNNHEKKKSMKKNYLIVLIATISCMSIYSCKEADSSNRESSVEYTVKVNSIAGENHEFWKAIGYDFLFKIVHEKEGQEFLNRAYTTAPQCVLSRAGIMIGRSTVDVRMTRFTAPLRRDVVAFPEKLREAGYYTGICGRTFHVDGTMRKDLPVASEVLQKQHLQTFEDRVDFLHRGRAQNNLKVFTEFLEQVPEGKPFFLQLNYSDPHRRYTAPDFAPDPDGKSVTGTLPDFDFVREDLAQHIGEINRLDMHVPLIARWPGHIKPGLVSDELISGEDIAPTFIEVANWETPEEMTGVRIVATFQDEAYDAHDYVFAVRGTHAWGPPIRTPHFDLSRVVIGKLQEPWNTLYFSPQRPMYDLYDLEEDPYGFPSITTGLPRSRLVLLENLNL